MKTVYFDTYVYNKLVDDKKIFNEIIKFKNAKKIEIILSDYIFAELACALRSNNSESRRKGQYLFEVVLKLTSGKVLKQLETLINEEIKAFLDNKSKPDIFLIKIVQNYFLILLDAWQKMRKLQMMNRSIDL